MTGFLATLTGFFKPTDKDSATASAEETHLPSTINGDTDSLPGQPSRKHAREGGCEDSPRKRHDARGAHDRRLEGDFGVPPDSQPLTMFQPRSKTFLKPSRRLGIQPRDTLNQASPHAAGKGLFKSAQNSRTTQTYTKQYSGVSSSATNGDGFNSPERDFKRRKLDMASVDLTGDEDAIVYEDVVARNGKRISEGSQSSRDDSRAANKEWRTVDNLTRTTQKNPRRKGLGVVPGSSQNSSRGSLDRSNGTKQQVHPNMVIEIDDETSQQLKPKSKRQERDSIDAQRSSSSLTNGALKRGSQEDILASGSVLSEAVQGRNAISPRKAHDSGTNVAQSRSIQQPHSGEFKDYIRRDPAERPSSPPLRKRFERDTPAKQQRQKAPDRMKGASSASPAKVNAGRTSYGSVDELNGETTVHSQTSRQSPSKDTWVPTNFTQFLKRREPSPVLLGPGRNVRKGDTQSKKTKRSEEEVRLPLAMIACRSCYLKGGDLQLVWDEESRFFKVEVDGTPQPIPNRDQLVCIGISEAKEWFDVIKDEVPWAYIKGPLGHNSNGHILLRFIDNKDVTTCLQFLSYATTDSLKSRSVKRARMEGIFKTTLPGIKEDFEKHAVKKLSDGEMELHLMKQRKIALERRRIEESGEQIRYEYGSSDENLRGHTQLHPTSSRRGNTTRTRSSPVTERSRHFPPDSRRSLRKPSAPKPKSPTPPPPPVRWTVENKPERWAHSVVYPPEGLRRVTVDFQDLERLDEGEFLNDNVISFALRQIEENMVPEHKEVVHFFNSFFYTALTTKNGKKTFNYDAVKRWTKNKDLFGYPYIVVPINIDLHWFVAIICNLPSIARKASGEEEDGNGEDDAVSLNEDHGARDGIDPISEMTLLSLSDDGHNLDKRSGDGGALHFDTLSAGRNPKKKAPVRKYDPDSPAIITLDSFGSRHTGEIRNLKDYLTAEADDKRKMSVVAKDLQGMTAKGIPEQTNFCDCGLYLMGYIEQFAKNPREFVTKVLTGQLDKESDFASFDPSAKRAEIRDQLLALSQSQEKGRKTTKTTKKVVKPPLHETVAEEATASTPKPIKDDAVGQKPIADVAKEPQIAERPAQLLSPLQVQQMFADGADDLEVSVPRPLHSESTPRKVPSLSATVSRGEITATNEPEEMLDDIDDTAELETVIRDSQEVVARQSNHV